MNSLELTKTINDLNTDMNEMSTGIKSSVNDIARVNQKGGNGTAAFVRKESKKVAKVIDYFSSKLRERNKSIDSLWDEIEKNTLGLLENRFAFSEDNRDYLTAYLKSLQGLQDAITQSNLSVEELKNSMNNNLGLERSMNQAIRFAVADLSSYIVITERIKASVDKILAKGKFVVGNID